jgi:hypothetical protein
MSVTYIKPILGMNDRVNTCNKIHGQDLTLTFISRSHLGQKPVKTANSLKICILTCQSNCGILLRKLKSTEMEVLNSCACAC